jgi:hypothetical protein
MNTPTKLTPATPPQIAMINEAARQAATGEAAAKYWSWVQTGDTGFYRAPTFVYELDWNCRPSEKHPHFETYFQWKSHVESGAVERGEYVLCMKQTDLIDHHKLTMQAVNGSPTWLPANAYEIRKTALHSDNQAQHKEEQPDGTLIPVVLDDNWQPPLETAIRDKIKELNGAADTESKSASELVDYLLWLATTPVYKPEPVEPTPTQKKKLIDWSLIPLGANTNKGKLMSIAETSIHGRFFANVFEGQNCIAVELDELRLIEQTTFNHLPKGVQPPVVPGLVIEYLCVETENRGHFSDIGIQQNVYDNYLDLAKMLKRGAMLIAYRVIGVDTANANGWTDDPEQVK